VLLHGALEGWGEEGRGVDWWVWIELVHTVFWPWWHEPGSLHPLHNAHMDTQTQEEL
jgi:hypothetical protein